MESIDIDKIRVGDTAHADYYSEKGELLLAKGTAISPRHIDMMRRRNLFSVYARSSGDEDELSRLLAREPGKLGEIDLDEEREQPPARPQHVPGIGQVEPGQAGFRKLCRSSRAHALDKNIKKSVGLDGPVGPALRNEVRQIAVAERTSEYKHSVSMTYNDALGMLTRLLNDLADGKSVDGNRIRKMAGRFVDIFLNDRNILLNISNTKHNGGDYLYHHSLNVCLLSINIAAANNYSRSQIVEIGMGAALHDVGMLLIPGAIRTKKGKLSSDEWFEVQKHPILGLHLLEKVSHLPASVPYMAYQVHERENRTGYPKQRNGMLVHRYAKIVQIADVYEAMTAPRSYRAPHIPFDSMTRIVKMGRKEFISCSFVNGFLEYASLFPVGSLLELSDHRVAKVVHANGNAPERPVVSILTDTEGNLLPEQQVYQEDLSLNREQLIIKALPCDYLKNLEVMHGF